MSDYSTYIHVYNHTSAVTLNIAEGRATQGHWVKNLRGLIKPGEVKSGQVKDSIGMLGSESSIQLQGENGSFEAEAKFLCGYGMTKNKVSWTIIGGSAAAEFKLTWKSMVDSGHNEGKWIDGQVSPTGEPLHVHFKVWDK